jgi:hypothetical protein
MKNTYWIADDDWNFPHTSAQTTPEKVSEKQRN